ncbi:MAG TPA: hypothetical protein DCX53_00990 [Anaerolineae bacterium]|nr:hypothetical protein [Anaerolineae bacterium]
MKTLAFFILGLLFGWLIEWIIDWFYWRKKYQQVRQENENLKQQVASLEAEKQSQAKPHLKKSPIAKPKKDDLKRILGIGPVISKKLNDAGITTFEQMADLKPNQLENILGDLIKRLSDEAGLIAQAKELARKKKSQA